VSYRDVLRTASYDSHGLVTLDEARELGIPAVEVHKLASRGVLHRLGKGVYRVADAPHGALDQYAEAVAVVGTDAFLADEAVLAAAELAPVNLRRITVAAPRAIRHRLPDFVEVIKVPETLSRSLTMIDGIPSMPIAEAIRRCRPTMMSERLAEATRLAEARGLISAADADELLAELESA
jgi:predicted transcriptional regulator of viral defense system